MGAPPDGGVREGEPLTDRGYTKRTHMPVPIIMDLSEIVKAAIMSEYYPDAHRYLTSSYYTGLYGNQT